MDTMAVGVQGIEAVCADQGVGHPILFVHGWGAWHRYWRHLWPRMVPRFRSLAVDLPGFGLSEEYQRPEWNKNSLDVPNPYTIEWYADWLADLIAAKKLEQTIVVGHSMGGTIALQLAIRHPECVERLVLINPVVTGSTAFSRRTQFLTSPAMRPFAYLMTKFDAGLRTLGEEFTSSRPMELEDLKAVRMASYAALTASVDSLKKADLSASASQVKAPTLILTSADDRMVDPLQGAGLAKSIPGSRHRMLPGVGHCCQLEAPEAVSGALLEGLEDVPRPGRPRQW